VFGFLNRLVGTAVLVLALVFAFAYVSNQEFREWFRSRVDEISGRDETISAQAIVYLSESVVEVGTRDGFATGVITTERLPWTVLTAGHVADQMNGAVRRPGRSFGTARLIDLQYGPDIAALEVTFPSNARPAVVTVPPRAAEPPEVGDIVATLCHSDDAVRQGHVIELVTRAGGVLNIFTDISAEPGCSGSPLVSAEGQLLGILIQGSAESSLAVALPPAGP